MGAIDAIATAVGASIGALFGGAPAPDAEDGKRPRAVADINALALGSNDPLKRS